MTLRCFHVCPSTPDAFKYPHWNLHLVRRVARVTHLFRSMKRRDYISLKKFGFFSRRLNCTIFYSLASLKIEYSALFEANKGTEKFLTLKHGILNEILQYGAK